MMFVRIINQLTTTTTSSCHSRNEMIRFSSSRRMKTNTRYLLLLLHRTFVVDHQRRSSWSVLTKSHQQTCLGDTWMGLCRPVGRSSILSSCVFIYSTMVATNCNTTSRSQVWTWLFTRELGQELTRTRTSCC